MLVPAKRNFFDDFMMSPFDAFFDAPQAQGKPTAGLMKTDIKETDKDFQLTIDLPGVKKEDVTVQIADGYLDIEAESKHETEDKDENGAFLRKERFEGKCSRKFYVGDEIDEDAITAKFENGTLKVTVPKKTQPEIESKKTIAIEG
ncbi:MAG: Hsp20/alpha crystallin family protein [Denitrobacterium sp.]|jgi:HSP20 family protein|nr:Hsp20/alpha crystallin family protein [Denitrobacterium sp.]